MIDALVHHKRGCACGQQQPFVSVGETVAAGKLAHLPTWPWIDLELCVPSAGPALLHCKQSAAEIDNCWPRTSQQRAC
jgi:hypothetical protein